MEKHLRPPVRRPHKGASLVVVCLVSLGALTACSGEAPRLGDLPQDVAAARPGITAEEAEFVLAARELGAIVNGETLAVDLETGTTTCWALKNGGVTLEQIAVDEADQPLGNTGDALRAKQLMAAGVEAFCPDYDDQIPQLALP